MGQINFATNFQPFHFNCFKNYPIIKFDIILDKQQDIILNNALIFIIAM